MLVCLRVKHLAIIDELEVEFPAGLNVVTGETGAGKSILVTALSVVLGQKAGPQLVRTGSTEAEIEALFDVTDHPVARELARQMGVDSDGELVLRRVIQSSGRSRAYVNGRLASAQQLADLAQGLCDISSQHEHHTLVNASSHMLYLDAFADLNRKREQMAEAFGSLSRAHAELAAHLESIQQRGEREDLLRHQVREIEDLDPKAGEQLTLVEERDRLRHAERLMQLTGGTEEALYSGDDALCTQLARLTRNVEDAAAIDPRLAKLATQLGSAHSEIEDVARELSAYANGVVSSPDRLNEVEERLEALSRIARKYGGHLEAALAHKEQAKQLIENLERGESRTEELRAAVETQEALARKLAEELSIERKAAAKKLGRAVSKELASLAMGDATITVEVEASKGRRQEPGELTIDGAKLSSTGIDRVEFLIAPNRGETPRPLSQIASGGELSRAMLGLKRVLAGLGPGGLYVFDEVDSGVGGAVAEVIGQKIREVSRHHQVLCITHLPQIAVYADTHYRVQKRVEKGRTHSEIVRLSKDEQLEEVARMLGGIEITRETRAAAREMLKSARR